MITRAVIRFEVEGFHKWPDAPYSRAYLNQPHRHVFKVEARIQLRHNEREIEFHDFLDYCKGNFPHGDLGSMSCETLAEDLLNKITLTYPNRSVRVSVFEDGENGAICEGGSIDR